MRDPEETRRALGHVAIARPDPSWPRYFMEERERLRPFLGGLAERLQHYGSTAVPGLSAKPIVDMMAPVPSLARADAVGRKLAGAGYRAVDAGFFRRRFFRRAVEGADVAWHLHLVVATDWPLKDELLLRDWLIGHPEVARAYASLKAELAAAYGDDMPRYTEGKTLFLRRAVNDARVSAGLPLRDDWEE